MEKTEDLKKKVFEKKLELIKLLSNKVSKGEKNLKKGRNLKKEIAQILTVVKEMEILEKEKGVK